MNAVFYKQSFDEGETFVDSLYKVSYPSLFTVLDGAIVSDENNNLLCIVKGKYYTNRPFDIFMKKSIDNGASWRDTLRIVQSAKDETEIAVNKDKSGKISLLYVREDTVKFIDSSYWPTPQIHIVSNIYYKQSVDFGDTWSEEKKLTKYISDDKFIGTSTNNQKNLISYSSQKRTEDYQIFYGVLDESEDLFHPPKLFFAYSRSISNESEKFQIRAYVKDDEKSPRVTVAISNSNVKAELYDDGNHDDWLSNDGIYANAVDIPTGIMQSQFVLDVNKISMPFANDGKIAAVHPSYQFESIIEVADSFNNTKSYNKNMSFSISYYGYGGVYDGNTFLFSGGFLMSGLAGNELWANGVSPSGLVQDYIPGKVSSMSSDYQNGFYVVKKDDKPFGTTWLQWRDAVNMGAEFYDGDSDGFYNPKDKNYNGIWDKNEDMPAILGDVTAWCVYNDGMPPEQRRYQSNILGIEIRQTVFASSNPKLQNVIFIKYNFLNTGLKSEVLDSVYFGFWADADIGEAYNDLVACDTLLQSGYTYSYGETDTSWSGYGISPPAFFTTLLQGPVILTDNLSDTAKLNYGSLIGAKEITNVKNLDMSSFFYIRKGDPWYGDPNSANQVRNYQLGLDRNGIPADPCELMYGHVLGGVDCHTLNPNFHFSGDPVTQTGWLLKYPSDARTILNTGPFKLEKNKSNEIIAAYVVGRGVDSLNSITVAREIAKRALLEYENNFSSMIYQPGTPLYPVVDYKLYQNYPNPFNPITTIRFEIPEDGIITLKVFNTLGEEVVALLNEFRKADRYEVNFDASKLASGIYIYQIEAGDFIASRKMMV